jgi:hypothetical protein
MESAFWIIGESSFLFLGIVLNILRVSNLIIFASKLKNEEIKLFLVTYTFSKKKLNLKPKTPTQLNELGSLYFEKFELFRFRSNFIFFSWRSW